MDGIIKAMIGVCNPFDLLILSKFIEDRFSGIISRTLGAGIIKVFKERIPELRGLEKTIGPLEIFANRAKTVRDFDTAVTAKTYGYDSVKNYYRKASCVLSLNTIKIPCFFLSAIDDIVVRYFYIKIINIALKYSRMKKPYQIQI